MINPKDILKSELIRNTSVLVTGTVMAQLLYIILQPVVRRLYPVSAFGTYSAYMSLIGMISVFTTLRYDDAIVLPARDKDSANLLSLSAMIAFCITLLLFIFILFFDEKIPGWINLPKGFPVYVLYLIPAGAFLINLYQCFNYWLVRKKKFMAVSLNKMIRRGTEGAGQVSLFLLKFRSGLIFSDFAGQVANVAAGIIQGIRNGFSFRMISFAKMRYVARKYSEFPRYNLIPAFMSSFSFLMPPLLINKFFSAENAGFFDASKTILSIPLAFVASSISSVLLQKSSDRVNKKESLIPDLKPLLLIVLAISIAEILAIIIAGPWLFRIGFSSPYEISGRISRIMVWSFVLNFFVSSFSSLFYSLRKILTFSIWQVFYFFAIISLLFLGKLEFTKFLTVYVAIEVVCYTVLVIIILDMVRKYERDRI